MYEMIKSTLEHLTFSDLQKISDENDLRINPFDLATLHHLLTQHWNDIMDETSLSLKEDTLKRYSCQVTISKFKELITSIKRNIIFKTIF